MGRRRREKGKGGKWIKKSRVGRERVREKGWEEEKERKEERDGKEREKGIREKGKMGGGGGEEVRRIDGRG